MSRRAACTVLAALGLVAFVLGPSGVAADEPEVVYTILGRGYAAVVGYPADEVPSTGEEEAVEDPPPDQTCPEGQRGVASATATRLEKLADPGERPPLEPVVESRAPTPRGQPIRFTFGLADGSLRSDPGVHGIAAGFYVDLGGAQDPWTSAETDGYVTGHAREQERCGNLFAGKAGSAEDVHVLSRSVPGPATFDYTHLRRTVLPGVGSFESAVTRVQMDGRSTPTTAQVVTTVEGIDLFGQVHADAVTTVVDYRTDGTDAGTTVHAWTTASGVTVAGQPVEVPAGAAPVAEDRFVLGVAEPQVRQREGGALEVEAGGLYVGAEADNPLGLQAKQGISLGGARLTADAFQRAVASTGDVPSSADPTTTAPSAPPTLDEAPAPVGGTTSSPPPGGVSPPDVAGPRAATEPVVAIRRLGVYVTPREVTGLAGVGALTVLALLGTTAAWLRERSWRFGVLLGAPGVHWIDRAYRAFLKG